MTQGILLGANIQQEWLLHWWWQHYARCNDFPVAVADFGLSRTAKEWIAKRAKVVSLPEKVNQLPILIRKPSALLASPFKHTLWLDLDCEVKGSLEPLFQTLLLGVEIAFVREGEKAHSYLRSKGLLKKTQLSFNTGVLGIKKSAPLLQRWASACKTHTEDQYALTYALYQEKTSFIEWPYAYNWPHEAEPNPNALILHYHGLLGKKTLLERLLKNNFTR